MVHLSQIPQTSQSIPRKPVFPALPQLSSRGSTDTTVERGTSLWESVVGSLVGKRRGKASWKASRESYRSLDPRVGKSDTAATAREKSARACPHSCRGLTALRDSRSTPRSMSALERNPQVLAPNPHKVLGPGINGRGIPRGPLATRIGTVLS